MVDADVVAWIVYFPDDDLRLETNQHQGNLEMRGFMFDYNDTHSLMNVIASEQNNRTVMQCREFIIGQPSVFSEEATLIVLGKDVLYISDLPTVLVFPGQS